jgi:hypothetical protein
MMTPEEHRACVEAIEARRDEEGDYQAAAFCTALAARIDQRIRQLDREIELGRRMVRRRRAA